jgi:hypothetical protein
VLGVILLLCTVAAACEKNDDGSISVDQAYLCVRTGDGDIRWTANKDCRQGEIENIQMGGGPVATCQADVHGAAVVTGYTTASLTGSSQFVVEWTSPGPQDGVTVTCANAPTRTGSSTWR